MDLLRDINYEIVALQETLVAAELLLAHRRAQVTDAEVAARDVRVEIAHLEGARRRLLVASGAAHEDTLRDRVRRVARMVGDDVQADLRRAQALVERAYPPEVEADVAPEDVRAHSCVCHGDAHTSAPPAGGDVCFPHPQMFAKKGTDAANPIMTPDVVVVEGAGVF